MFSARRKIAIDKDLYQRLVETAQREGYASVDELITHVLERATADTQGPSDGERAAQQLRGLGYIE